MTSVIINDVLPLTQLISAAGQTVFTTNWTADADADVLVYARATGVDADDATQLVSSSLYTVGYTGASEIVFITFLSGRTLSDVITITRVTPVDRENLYTNTNFTPSMLNQDFGLFTLQIQENDLYNRQLTPRYNTSATIEPIVDIILPILTANQIWAKNNADDAFIAVDIPTAGFAPADSTYVTLSDQTSVLPNSLPLNSLGQGFLVNLPGTPTLVARSILGTSNEITIVNGTGLGGNLTVSIPDNPIMPGTAGMGIPSGTTGQRVIPVSNINLRFNTTDVQLEYWDGGTWQQLAEGGSVVALTAGTGITLTPNPIIETGSIALAAIADHTLLANISGGALAPSSTTLTALIDNAIGSTQGDILYRNATSWVVLAPGTNGQFLQTAGAAANPLWATATGGTVTSFSAGTLSPLFTTSVATATTTPVLSFILTNAGANTYFGNATGAPAAPSYTAGAALTKTDDTNVTMTLGGTPASALLVAASMTLGWTGQLSLARGGTNANLTAVQGGIAFSTASAIAFSAAGSTGQLLRSAGTGTPTWTTATFPVTAGSSGNVLVSDGTNWSSSSTTGVTALGAQAQALNMNSHLINGVTDPVSPQDAATKAYVDAIATGLNILPAAYAATTGPLNATYSNGSSGVGATLTNAGTMAAFTLDGTTPPITSRILVKDQTINPFQNGVYTLTTVGSGAANWVLTRATDYNTVAQINPGDFILINNGDANSATGWIQTATVATIGTDAINFSLFSSPQAAVNPNIIIGGNFDTNPWQRGTTFVAAVSGQYVADRFKWSQVGAGVVTGLKTLDAPTITQAGIFSQYCFHIDVTTADAAIAATDFYSVNYRMEGLNFVQIAQRPFTLSFWIKSTKTGTFGVGLGNNNDRSIVMEYTVNTTDTWEKKILLIPASPASGTWQYTNGLGLDIWFGLALGSNYSTATIGSWQNSLFYGSSNQVNAMDNAANNFKLQLVKIEPGPYATAWPYRSSEEELALCQRYYEKSYNQGTDPATAVSVGSVNLQTGVASTGQICAGTNFAVTKRVTPTLVSYDAAGASGKCYLGANGVSTSAGNPGASSVSFCATSAGQSLFIYNWTADADL